MEKRLQNEAEPVYALTLADCNWKLFWGLMRELKEEFCDAMQASVQREPPLSSAPVVKKVPEPVIAQASPGSSGEELKLA